MSDRALRRLDGRVSRRGLLTSGVLAGVLAASGVATAGSARGGALRLGVPGPLPGAPADWDLARSPSALASLGHGAIYEGLVEIGPRGHLAGDLAVSWDCDALARTWSLELTREARFHDGGVLAAADVAASLERHRDGSPAAWILARVAAIEAPTPHMLRLTLHDGDPSFPFLLAHPRLVVGPAGRLDGTGTGPYRLPRGEGAAGPDRLRLERVPHRKDGRAAWFDAVEAVALADPAARARALIAGEVDAIEGVGPVEAALLARAGLVVTGPNAGPGFPPFDRDPDLAALSRDGGARARGLASAGPPSPQGPLDGGRAALRWWWA